MKIECCGAKFYHEHDLQRLDQAQSQQETTKTLISIHKGCRLLVFGPVHCGSNSIVKVRFFGTPCMLCFNYHTQTQERMGTHIQKHDTEETVLLSIFYFSNRMLTMMMTFVSNGGRLVGCTSLIGFVQIFNAATCNLQHHGYCSFQANISSRLGCSFVNFKFQ